MEGFELQAFFEGSSEGPVWTGAVSALAGTARLEFSRSTGGNVAAGCDWPNTVDVTFLRKPDPRASVYISPEPTAAELTAMGHMRGAIRLASIWCRISRYRTDSPSHLPSSMDSLAMRSEIAPANTHAARRSHMHARGIVARIESPHPGRSTEESKESSLARPRPGSCRQPSKS